MKKRNIFFIFMIAAVTVMIHIGGGTVYKAFERSHDGRVNVNIHQMRNLRQNSRSLHTSAAGQYISVINRWDKDPILYIGTIKGDLPILFYNNEKGKYGYVNRNGKVVIEEEFKAALEFNDSGIAITSKGVIDTNGNVIVSGSENGDEQWNIYRMYYVDEENRVIFCRCDQNSRLFIVSDFSGNKKAQISEAQFKDCVFSEYSEKIFDTDKVRALKESLGLED